MSCDISCCGTDCSVCEYKNMCGGCNALKGRVFHAPEGRACPIYECCSEKNGFNNCGQCSKLPCDIIRGARDPNYSDEEFERSILERVNRLKEMNR